MRGEGFYLRQNVQVEPLIDQWYAWPHLVPPATAACNTVQRHLKIMDSYIAAPLTHAAAVKNPKMLGGPFVDLGGVHVEEIKALREDIATKRANLLGLYRDLTDLNEMLGAKAKGFSLQPLYAEVPDRIRGYVELVYDLNNNPSFRVIEPFFYKSKYYDASAQSLMLSLITGDDRPFVLSTPRLLTNGALHLHWPFSDERVNKLFSLKANPQSIDSICESLGLSGEESKNISQFLTTEAPAPYAPYTGPGVRWRYFGHACILIESGGVSILVDPVLSYTYEAGISRYTYSDLPDVIDYVLVTHNHQDHLLFETMLQLRHRIRHIIVPRNGSGSLQDPSLKLILENTGFTNVTELAELTSIAIDGGSIIGIPFFGEHCDLAVHTKLAYLIQLGPTSLMFAADSCNIEPRVYDLAHRCFGDVDILFLGMECDGGPLSWLYGPLLLKRMDRKMDESRRLSGSHSEQALNIVKSLNCKHVYVYAMGQEPWLNYIMSIKYTEQSRPIVESNKLISTCVSQGLVAERLFGEKEIVIEFGRHQAVEHQCIA